MKTKPPIAVWEYHNFSDDILDALYPLGELSMMSSQSYSQIDSVSSMTEASADNEPPADALKQYFEQVGTVIADVVF